jgi:hypothetical protein
MPQAGMLSVHLENDLFMEMRMYATANQAPLELARGYRDRVRGLKRVVRDYVGEVRPHPYALKLLLSYPDMLEVVGQYTVGGADDKHALLRAYLPVMAAHNLALATRLAVMEQGGGGGGAAAVAVKPQDKPKTLQERMQEKTSYSIPRSPLDLVVGQLGEVLGTEIVLLGTDMQKEGITKNQQVQLDAEDKTYAEILQGILLKANPAGKLIYVYATKDGKEILNVTTRAAAEARGDTIPPEFKQ